MIFLALMIIVTAGMATCAAYFSIYGLTQIFNGVFWAAVAMGTVLEAGKLMGASYLYRYRHIRGPISKVSIGLFVIILMAITSAGIFGFLTASYQQDNIGLKDMDVKIELINEELDYSKKRLSSINEQLEAVPPNYVTKRMELQEKFDPEKTSILERIDNLQKERLELSSKKITTEAKIGPILYVAEVLEEDPDKATFWFVLLIVIAFDPFAVAMTIGVNKIVEERKREKSQSEPEPTITPTTEPPEVIEKYKTSGEMMQVMMTQLQHDLESIERNLKNTNAKDVERISELKNKRNKLLKQKKRFNDIIEK